MTSELDSQDDVLMQNADSSSSNTSYDMFEDQEHVLLFTRVKDVGTRITDAEQRNKKIIDLAQPLPEDNALTARSVYWFVTTEQVELLYEDAKLFVWKESFVVGGTYYLNQVHFQQNKRGEIWFKFPNEDVVKVLCASTAPKSSPKQRIKLTQAIDASEVVSDNESDIYEDLHSNTKNIQFLPSLQPITTEVSTFESSGQDLQGGDEDSQIPFTELTLGSKVGEGASATVYKAEWKGQTYAVKSFKLTGTTIWNDNIIKETNVWRRLNHEGIVSFIGVAIEPETGGTMLVLEYMEDGSLEDLLKDKNVQLSRENIIQIALDIARGLYYLHSQKILHRDLKSANVLLYNNKKNAKLSDFGTVRVFVNSTKASTSVGTWGFMAPEILREELHNAKADVYSFSALLYNMLTRKRFPNLFKDDAAAKKRVESDVKDFALRKLILQCCKANPEQRPTIEECINTLEIAQKILQPANLGAFANNTNIFNPNGLKDERTFNSDQMAQTTYKLNLDTYNSEPEHPQTAIEYVRKCCAGITYLINRSHICYTRVKDVGTKLKQVEQRNKRIIEIAKPLPKGNRLPARSVYWFVTTENVQFSSQDEELFFWKETTTVTEDRVVYYLNQADFHKNKKGSITVTFPNNITEVIFCYSTLPASKKAKSSKRSNAIQLTSDN